MQRKAKPVAKDPERIQSWSYQESCSGPYFAINLLRALHAFAARYPFRLLGCGATWMSVEVDSAKPPVHQRFVFEPVQGQPGRWRGSAGWFDD